MSIEIKGKFTILKAKHPLKAVSLNGCLQMHETCLNIEQFSLLQSVLNVETEVDNITIFDDVLLTLKASATGSFSALLTFVLNVIVITDCLSADEAFFEVGVDHAGGLWGGCSLFDGPGADFFYACGKVGMQSQKFVASANNAVESWFVPT
jgi:hypothetical protein